MDNETKRLLCNDLVRLREQAQAASIAGYDNAAAQLQCLAEQVVARLEERN